MLDRFGAGKADLSVRGVFCQEPSTCSVATSMIIRRNIDPGARSTLAILDFSDEREAFRLVPRTLTLKGMSVGTSFGVDEAFSTSMTSLRFR